MTSLETHSETHTTDYARHRVFSLLAALALGAVIALAFSPSAEPTLADRVTLLALGIVAVVLFWTPLLRRVETQHNVAAFALTAAMFIVYGMARRAGPETGKIALQFSALPGDKFIISYAAWAVALGALLTAPAWGRHLTGWSRSFLIATVLLALLALGSFLLLRLHYPVGLGETVDPTPLPNLGLQIVEYGCLALLCDAATGHPWTRRLVLRVLPLALLALWARHQFMAPPPPVEDE
ncbi:MAG TPA: hypothetical protein VNA16_07125 [Abditibacteriaceae bacterium]|nr:hypothetical protein [Abditibacteriaceae bacterium]